MYNPDKVDDYSKKQLAEMIFNGEVSREQVDEDGLFRKHRPLLDEELSLMTQEELDWTEATTKNTVGSYQVYLEKYNPTIGEGETVTDGWVENTVYIGRHVEDARRLQTAVKQLDDDEKENEKDKAAWVKAKNADTIECYIEYISTFDRQPPLYRGQYVDEAKLRINKLQDNIDWGKAKSLDTKDSYETYLSKYDSPASSYQGAYISDAKKAIERLTPKAEPALDPLRNETEDWAKAVRADNIEAYNNYLAKYEFIGGKYVAQAKKAIERLLEEKTWSEASTSNNITGYKKYINIYQNKNGKHLEEAKRKINQLEDDLAWMVATKEDNHSAYQNYISCYDVLAPKYRGRHIEDAKRRIAHLISETDDREWGKACKADTITAYRLYLSKFGSDNSAQKGKHIEDAKVRINSLMDDACWADTVKQNTHEVYQDYIRKYPQGVHVAEAHKRLRPPVPPRPILKYVLTLLLVSTACIFFGIQYLNKAWPFSQEENTVIPTPIAEVDSLQWAIDNHDIPLLQKYADLDSTRAYYPLSLELWMQFKDTLNSLMYIREAIESLTAKGHLYSDYEKHLNAIKEALDYDNTIGHVTPALPSNIEERLMILPKEQAIINKASAIAKKYSFKYTPNPEILKYIEDDFRRWVKAGDNSPILATKEDCYKAALQLKEDSIVRTKLRMLYK